jgi:hypothetical protein
MKSIFLLISIVSIFHSSQQANVNVCNESKNLYNRNGDYLKTICELHFSLRYDEAAKFCRNNGMELLVLDSEDTFEAVVAHIVESPELAGPNEWGSENGIRINGQREVNRDWFAYTPDRTPLWSKLPFLYTSGYGEPCLLLKRKVGFYVTGYSCARKFYSICEFDVTKPKVDKTVTPAPILITCEDKLARALSDIKALSVEFERMVTKLESTEARFKLLESKIEGTSSNV